MKAQRILLGLLVAGICGWAVFAGWLARTTEIATAPAAEARAAFAAVREAHGGQIPWLLRDADGRFVSTVPDSIHAAAVARGRGPRLLHVLAWHAADGRLVRSDIPFWYVRLKDVSLTWLLRRAGVDLAELRLRPRELARLGPGLVLDTESADGDLLLIWTE